MSCFQTWDAESHIEEAKLRAVEDRARARWRDTHESLPRKEKEPWRMMDATRLRDFIRSQKDDEERLAHELRALSEEEERLSNEAKLESSMQIAAAIADSAAPRRASSPSTESGHILDKNVGSSHASRVRIRSATMWARVHVSRRTNTSFERLMHTYTCDARLHASRASHPRACLRRGAILPRSRCFVKSNLHNRRMKNSTLRPNLCNNFIQMCEEIYFATRLLALIPRHFKVDPEVGSLSDIKVTLTT